MGILNFVCLPRGREFSSMTLRSMLSISCSISFAQHVPPRYIQGTNYTPYLPSVGPPISSAHSKQGRLLPSLPPGAASDNERTAGPNKALTKHTYFWGKKMFLESPLCYTRVHCSIGGSCLPRSRIVVLLSTIV